MVCIQHGIPQFAHSLNVPNPYIKYWPEDGSLEPKHVANYVLITIYVWCVSPNKLLFHIV
jgi:hypothetical protein